MFVLPAPAASLNVTASTTPGSVNTTQGIPTAPSTNSVTGSTGSTGKGTQDSICECFIDRTCDRFQGTTCEGFHSSSNDDSKGSRDDEKQDSTRASFFLQVMCLRQHRVGV